MYRIQQIEAGSRVDFRDLTFPLFRPLLMDVGRQDSLIAVGASLLGQPVGLAFAELKAGEDSQAELHSIAVAPQHRRTGLAFRLLSALEDELLSRNTRSVRVTFMSDLPHTQAVEALFRKARWSTPHHRMMVCDTDVPTLIDAPWVQKRNLPCDFEIFPWLSITDRDLDALRDGQKLGWYPEELTPFRNEHLTDPLTSLGLRYRNKLAGWCITHILDEDTLRYSTLFVRQEHQRLGRAIPLLANSISRTSRFKGRFDVAVDNRSMIRFVHKRMAPYMLNLRYIRASQKALCSNDISVDLPRSVQ